MDFSSIPRALESLLRRSPPLPDSDLHHVEKLKDTHDLNALKALGTSERWESLAVSLYVGTSWITAALSGAKESNPAQVYMDGPRVPDMADKTEGLGEKTPNLDEATIWKLACILHPLCLEHLEHAEPRVRTLVAKAVGAYSAVQSPGTLEMISILHARLAQSIFDHLKSGRDDKQQHSTTSNGAMDDTTGWRALETNWLCLAALVSGMKASYFQYGFCTDQLFAGCEESAVSHVNRHVRAAAMQCLEQWVRFSPDADTLQKIVQNVLKTGLADNWSQVRMAASVLCRAWFTSFPTARDDHSFMAILLPRMCLNRFYLAAGVKLYSHETWKLLFAADGSGLTHLQQHMGPVVRYYVKMCDADNHAVREAACQAIAEMANRVPDLEPDTVETLLQALLMCFFDESWPVRDEACLACGTLCKAYPEACRGELNTLWERWTEQVTDQIWSVRADAAVAIGDAVSAFPKELIPKVRDVVMKLLPSARNQPNQTEAEYKAHINNVQDHSNTQLYSCGSLAPKLRKGGAGRIGCSSCGIDRPKAPWEATDGCLYLIRELVVRGCDEDSVMPMTDEELLPLWESMMDVCRVQHFPQSHELRATLWKCVPPMAKALGKQRFKRSYLECTVELLFRNLEMSTATQLSKHAAAECAAYLADLIGPGIFRGRLDDDQQVTYDRLVVGRPRGEPPIDSMMSPFGPLSVAAGLGK